MIRLAASLRSAFVAAALAVALLAFAQVRSDAMQAAELAGRDCGMSADAMASMPGATGGRRAAPDPARHAACPYCAAAAHAPLTAAAPALPLPTLVAWSPAPAATPPPARGPPALDPRARDPPTPPLTA